MRVEQLLFVGLLSTASCSTQVFPAPCGNQGIQWALYHNDQGPNNGGFYSNFSPEHFKTKKPIYQAKYGSIGGFNYTQKKKSSISIYGSSKLFNSKNFVLNHRFYFNPPVSDTYTITLVTPNDIAILWLRDNAYSGWKRANDEVDCTEAGSGSCSTFNVLMQAGTYYAMRVVYGQTVGTAGFAFTIKGTSSSTFIDSNTMKSPNIVQFSCDAVAPMFEPFGAET